MVKSDAEIRRAFAGDNYEVKTCVTFQGMRGYLAEHRTARNAKTQAPKRALYVEGDGYQMGYLTGLLAEPDVRLMAIDYVTHVIPAFVSPKLTGLGHTLVVHVLLSIMRNRLHEAYKRYPKDIPAPLQAEMHGIADGCRASNSETPVDYDDVLMLNAGIDGAVAAVYTGIGMQERVKDLLRSGANAAAPIPEPRLPRLEPEHFQVTGACAAFAAFGRATRDGNFYYGRDFQFPSAGIFQDTACLMIHNPTYKLASGKPALATVSQNAPGFVGSVVVVNTKGVGVGVDMAPSGNCNPKRPGLNSLLMVRYAGYCGYSAQDVVTAMVGAHRGSSWIYPIGDATNQRAVVVEAGMTVDKLNPLSYPPAELKPLLPAGPFQPSQRGLYARWDNWEYPSEYLQYNRKLFKHMGFPWTPAQFEERGYINSNWKVGMDQTYFFAPQRETGADLAIASNIFLVPEMRLCAMWKWTNLVVKNKMADLIWRYDELNRECLQAHGQIDEAKATELADFLSPDRQFPDYYGDNRTIEGSVSVCNLTERTIKSHFGYHDDEWVKLRLREYVAEGA